MQILQDILLKIEEIRGETNKPKNVVDPLPKPNSESLPQFVQDLWEDSQLFETSYYNETKHLRRSQPDEKGAGVGFSRENWDKACEALAYGENWEHVWGHRPEDWMKERVDGEIPRKLNVRKDHITAKYHEFTISPNIANIDLIYNQERKRMGAKDWIEEYVQMAMVYGRAVNEVVVDYNLHPQGQVRNVVRRYVGRTPAAKSFQMSDGCDYVIFPDVVSGQQIETDFPDLDVSELEPFQDSTWTWKSLFSLGRGKQSYKHTKFYQKYRVYIDDSTLEKVPFGEEEQIELIDELQQLMDGASVKAGSEQNHMAHIEAKIEALLNFLSLVPTAPDEEIQAIPVVGAHLENILEHLDFINRNRIETLGKRQKYPNGRYLCWIGGKVVRDLPNPLNVPWRKLVREVQNRRILNRIDGAGDPELMYREAFQADIMRSRMEELSLLALPQVWRKITDKQNKEIDVSNDNDPLKTKYFNDTPPVVVKTEPPLMLTRLYELSQAKQEKDTGINSIASGEQPPANTPAALVAIVQRQNRLIVVGELDRNLREALEDIIEGDLAVMRQLYKEPRQYIINGQVQDINVSDLLSFVEIAEGGRRQKVEIPMFEVSVKPGSNYPDQWEMKLTLLLDLRGRMTDPAKAAALDEAIMDHLAIEYPEFGEGQKYRVLEEATRIGLQVLQAQQQAQAEEGRMGNRARKVFEKAEDSGFKKQLTGGGNGETQEPAVY